MWNEKDVEIFDKGRIVEEFLADYAGLWEVDEEDYAVLLICPDSGEEINLETTTKTQLLDLLREIRKR